MAKRRLKQSRGKSVAGGGSAHPPPHNQVEASKGPSYGNRKTLLLCALLFLLVAGTFLSALHNDFINYDDNDYVTENTHVRQGLNWENVVWAFESTEAANWHPLTWLSHMLDCELFGLKPWGHHLTSILLHALNTALLFLVLRHLTGAVWRSLFVAALFGLHPLHVESVAWVAERKDVLSTCFWLLTLLAYGKYARGAKVYYGWALGCFALGLLCKPMLVTLPLVLLLLDYWPLRRWEHRGWGRLLLEKTPFFLLAATSSVVTFVVQRQAGAVNTMAAFPLADRLENALAAYWRYVGKVFWPVDLCVFYPYVAHRQMAGAVLAGLGLLAVTALAVILGRKRGYWATGWLWYVGTLVPVIGLVQVGSQSMADRYSYVPSIGLFILVAWGAAELTKGWRQRTLVLGGAGLGVAVLCLGLTVRQTGYWKESETLFRHALAITKDNWLADNNLGAAFDRKGQLDAAIVEYQKAIELRPDYLTAHINLAAALDQQGRFDEAINELRQALNINPNYAGAHCNLGNTLLKMGRLGEALGHYQEALKLQPAYADPHIGMGNLFKTEGRLDEAINQFQEALKLEPGNVSAHVDLGNTFLGQGSLDEALSQYRAADKLQPDDAPTHYNLGITLLRQGHAEEAASQFEQSLRLNPNNALARQNLGNILAQQGKFEEAISNFEAALRIDPNSAHAHYRFGLVLLQGGRRKEAAAHFTEALRLQPNYPEAEQQLRSLAGP